MKQIKTVNRRVAIEPGEEALHKPYNTVHAKERKEVTVAVGIDGGSTQTRVSMIDLNRLSELENNFLNFYTIPSVSVVVPDDRNIDDKGENLYDLMDATITNLSGDQESLFTSVRLARGTKAQEVEARLNRLNSSIQKTQDPVFYYNIIEGIAYTVLNYYDGEIPHKVNAFVGVALPPDDLNEKNVERFHRSLKNFRWTHRASGVSIDIEIIGITQMTEPEAFIKAYYSMADEELPEVCLHLAGGGRSIGVEILIGGDSLGSAQKTLEYGGTQLMEELNNLYVARYGGSPLRESVLARAMRTGFIKKGNSSIDATDLIAEAKKRFAPRIVADTILRVFDQQSQVTIDDLNEISFSGRLFLPTVAEVYDEENISSDGPQRIEVSLAEYVEEEFRKRIPDVSFLRIEGNYIPDGLLMSVLLEFVFSSSEDEAASTIEE